MSFRFSALNYLGLSTLCFVNPAMGSAALAAPAPSQIVTIKDFAFVPQTLAVAPGTTVTWVNADDDPHTVTATDKSFHSAALDGTEKFSFTFGKLGSYAYFCSLHPHMTGKIVVKAG